jgi:sulfur carrier protein ThiS
MQSELNETVMQSDPNRELEDLLKDLLTRRERVLTELNQLNALIATYQNQSSKTEVKSMPPLRQIKKQPRVRGVLAAARKAIDQLPSPFDKNQLLAKLDEEFTHKKITGANIRNALRLLTQEGVIKVHCEATATTCAQYLIEHRGVQ